MKVAIVLPSALSSIPKDTFYTFVYAYSYLLQRMEDLPFIINRLEIKAPTQFPIDANRNVAAAELLEEGFDLSIWLDLDQTFPSNTLFRLLNNSYPVVSGVYHLKSLNTFPVVFKRTEDDKDFTWFKPIVDYPRDDYFHADMVGMGCVKIDMKVFKAIADAYPKGELIEFFKYGVNPIRYEGEDEEKTEARVKAEKLRSKYLIRDVSEDVYFWKQVYEKTDYKIVVDPKIQCGHLGHFEYTDKFFTTLYDARMEMMKKDEPEKYAKIQEMICRAEKISSAS
jgi:hypothetical protein